jgi:hypothetical protein
MEGGGGDAFKRAGKEEGSLTQAYLCPTLALSLTPFDATGG